MDVLSSKADWNVVLSCVNPDGTPLNLSGLDVDCAFGFDALAKKYVATVSSGNGVVFTDAMNGVLKATVKRAARSAIVLKTGTPNNVVVDVFIMTGRGTANETRDFVGRATFALVEGVEQWT